MEVKLIKRIGDLSLSTIRKGDACSFPSKTGGHTTIRAVRRINGPVPVWQTNLVGSLLGLFSSVTRWEFIRDLDSSIVKNLLKQSEVRSVPHSKHITYVRTVAIGSLALHAIPLAEWGAVDA